MHRTQIEVLSIPLLSKPEYMVNIFHVSIWNILSDCLSFNSTMSSPRLPLILRCYVATISIPLIQSLSEYKHCKQLFWCFCITYIIALMRTHITSMHICLNSTYRVKRSFSIMQGSGYCSPVVVAI